MQRPILVELLRNAAEQPLGLCVTTTNAPALLHQLHEVQRDLQVPDIMLCTPSVENTIFIFRRSVELDP